VPNLHVVTKPLTCSRPAAKKHTAVWVLDRRTRWAARGGADAQGRAAKAWSGDGASRCVTAEHSVRLGSGSCGTSILTSMPRRADGGLGAKNGHRDMDGRSAGGRGSTRVQRTPNLGWRAAISGLGDARSEGTLSEGVGPHGHWRCWVQPDLDVRESAGGDAFDGSAWMNGRSAGGLLVEAPF